MRICNNKKCKNYNKTKLVYPIIKNNAIIDNYKCPICSKETKPAIIPPSSNKFINKNEFIHKLWLLARETLIKTDRLVFIGYSFPPNDYMAEWLFKHIYLTEDYENKNTLPEIVIVNPEIKKRNSYLKQRYKNIFPGIKFKTYGTLEDFCNNGLCIFDS